MIPRVFLAAAFVARLVLVAYSAPPPIEVTPSPNFFVSGLRGQGGRATVVIVNHESVPLRIQGIEHEQARFTTKLETLEPGKRYRLTLNLKPDGPAGRSTGIILLRTSSKKMPVLKVAANTYLYERVRTFPDGVDFGTVRASDPDQASQTLMIYQAGGSDFRVKVSTDVPACQVKSERGPKGDRYQLTVSLAGGRLKPGRIRGTITIETNDPQFSRLTVPVSGQVIEP